MMRKRMQNSKWLFFGLVPVAAGLGWVAVRLRRKGGARSTRNSDIAPALVEAQGYRLKARSTAPQPAGENKDQQAGVSTKGDWAAAETSPGSGQYGADSRQYDSPAAGHAMRREPTDRFFMLKLLLMLALLASVVAAFSLYRPPAVPNPAVAAGGDAERGRAALRSWGCGSCHVIPGVAGATGRVGPDLVGVGAQSFIAGELPNTPENMVLWIMDPQEVSPGNAMPDTDVTGNMAWDMAAYIYSISGGQIPGQDLAR